MSRIFISHSSKNNAHAIALRDWLIAGGWDDLFLDLDPERGIAAGERWERALNEAATRCEAVLFLVTREWLASGWCLKEFRLAGKLNKRMFGLLVDGLTIAELPPEISKDWQIVDLASGRDHTIFRAVTPNKGAEEHVHFSASGLDRLRAGLNRAGLDPKFFAWPPENDPDRPPYRGLKALEAEDAGIFFGREAPTVAALDRLRGLREAAAPRLLTILGASGAGKSSFLRAGLIPRLARDDRNFLPLPVMRPERSALSGPTGLVATLTAALAGAKLGVTRAQVQEAVQSGASAVLALLSRLVEAKCIPPLPGESNTAPPTLILSIDQGEELFLAEGADEAQAFLSILRGLAEAPNPDIIVIVAIRSDGYERLQSAPALEGVRQETFSLPPMPRGAFETVIEGPARRLKDVKRPLKIEPALTQTLLADIEAGGAKDALPLLAFTLERLFVDHGGDGDLTLEEYRLTGGVKGAIEAAVERAMREADGDARVPKDRSARLTLIRAALIPWLAGIDPETGAPRRRVARLTEIDVECRPLVEHLVAARLLATDISPEGAVTIEPAHEALLRQWGLLQGWLEEDFAALSALDGVKRATRDWEANARDSGWLAHAAGRLEDAEEFSNQASLRNYLDESDRAYLAACRSEDNARRDRELEEARRREADAKRIVEQQSKIVWRTRLGLVVASILALLAGGVAWVAVKQTNLAEAETRKSKELAEVGYLFTKYVSFAGNKVISETERKRTLYNNVLLAANRGNMAAENAIGLFHLSGMGVEIDYNKSLEWLERSASKGDASAMSSIGSLYSIGRSGPQDYDKALAWYKKAISAGDVEGMNGLGLLYAKGHGVPQDYGKALAWYEKAAQAGHVLAMINIGGLHERGQGVPQDFVKAFDWYQKAAEAGDGVAMRNIAIFYHKGQGVPQNFAKALAWYEKAEEEGDSASMNNIGQLHERGQGVPQDFVKALVWYNKAIEAGETGAMTNIGNLYTEGKGVPQDYAKAIIWYEKAATLGNAEAMRNLGIFYNSGLGVPHDIAKALAWYEKAAGAGDAGAMSAIGNLHYRGLGVQQDFAKAFAWYEKAAAAGDATAMFNIGILHANGQGVTQDFTKALYWNEKAAAAGHVEANTSIGWYGLLGGHATVALAASERGIAQTVEEAKKLPPKTNRALALMYLGRLNEARAAFLSERGKTIPDQGSWETVILNDFVELRKAGRDHPFMKEIEAEFARPTGK